MTTVKIKNKKYTLKYTLKMFFIYESVMSGETYTPTLQNDYLLFYCCLLANNEGFPFDFECFIDECDKNMGLFQTFSEFFASELSVRSQKILNSQRVENGKKGKKKA